MRPLVYSACAKFLVADELALQFIETTFTCLWECCWRDRGLHTFLRFRDFLSFIFVTTSLWSMVSSHQLIPTSDIPTAAVFDPLEGTTATYLGAASDNVAVRYVNARPVAARRCTGGHVCR